MRILINENGERPVCIRLPRGLVLNRISAAIISAALKAKGMDISDKQLHTLFREVNAYRRLHPEWKLVEVKDPDGATVEIVL